MTDAVTQDRMWLPLHGIYWHSWTTPYAQVTFGRYWRVSYGIGPFYGSFGYVEMF